MRRFSRHALMPIALAVLLAPALARAGVTLKVEGVDEDLRQAVTAAVRLSQYAKREVSAAQVRRLYAMAPGEARKALQPYGYYDAKVDAQPAAARQGLDRHAEDHARRAGHRALGGHPAGPQGAPAAGRAQGHPAVRAGRGAADERRPVHQLARRHRSPR